MKAYTVRQNGLWHDGFESLSEAESYARSNPGTYEILSYEVPDPHPTIRIPVGNPEYNCRLKP